MLYEKEARAEFAKETGNGDCSALNGILRRGMRIICKARQEIARREVVRCGKCRHWVPEDSRKDYGRCHSFGNKRVIWRRADGFCDRGDPREE